MTHSNHTLTVKTALITIAFLFSASVWADIKLEHSAQVEVTEKSADGKEAIKLAPANLVTPGSLLVYTITATNTGSAEASNIVIKDAISEHNLYVANSAGSTAIGKNTTITFSADGGKTFAAPDQLTIVEDGVSRPTTPEDYTHIRWQLNFALPPGKNTQVFFKTRLK